MEGYGYDGELWTLPSPFSAADPHLAAGSNSMIYSIC